jgi:dTDP-4-amino-4,6-dideoxygalactose transaminase
MIPLLKPYMPELPEMDAILHSGALAYGRYTKEFEEKLRAYFGTPYVLAVNTFHSAITVALTTLGIVPGDGVIASPMACLVSTQPYLAAGLSVRWADVDPDRGTLDPASVKNRITPRTKAIIHNHFCGYPGHIDEINAIGLELGIPVIDDGIECFGSRYKGRKIGACGTDVTVFALSAVRIPNCVEGGVVIFKDPELFQKALLIRDSGIDRSRFRDDIGEISPLCDISLVGYSAMMSDVNGYIGAKQMDFADTLLEKQQKQAQKWAKIIENTPGCKPVSVDAGVPNYWVYGLLAENKREAILRFREMGYYASGVHINNSIYSAFGGQDAALPGVDAFYNRFVALPCGWWMEE